MVLAGGLHEPTIVAVMGLPASGKTSLAERLAGRLGLLHLSSDVIRKELAGTRPTQRSGDRFGEGLYSQSMTRRTYVAQRRRAAAWLRRGGSVVLDATFGSADERAAVGRLAQRHGARLLVIECQADDATLQARLAARAEQSSTTSDARPELWPALKAAYSPPRELPGVHGVDMRRPLGDVVDQAIQLIRR